MASALALLACVDPTADGCDAGIVADAMASGADGSPMPDGGPEHHPLALTVTRSGSASGTIVSTPAGIACGTSCSASFAAGTALLLTATPDSGAQLVAWSGACTGHAATCTFTLDTDTMVGAEFAPLTHAVTVTVTGHGKVVSTPAGIDCGDGHAACTMTIPDGTALSLAATPASGALFAGWTGACSGLGSCGLAAVDADASIQAGFVADDVTLVVGRSGSGTGDVVSTPSGIECGAVCSHAFALGQAVGLQATATADSEFAGWSGACTGSDGCTVTMNGSQAVTATFTRRPVTLTVTKAGTGDGTVSGSGISCGADCSEALSPGTTITLTAVASTGSFFTGWSCGGCSGMGSCTTTVLAATTITATFAPGVSLEVDVYGVGSVSSDPAGISCGDTCTHAFPSGQSVVLTATPTANHRLDHWIGSCGTTTTCTLELETQQLVGAVFGSIWVAVTAGGGNVCGLRQDGSLGCWGNNISGQSSPPAGTFVAVGSGDQFGCAIRTDGTLACWTAITNFLLVPTGTFRELGVGRTHACAIRTDNTLACWGNDNDGQSTPPAGTFARVASGHDHTCGIRSDGTVACWGDDSEGQLTAPAGTFTALAAGYAHTCAVTSGGQVSCWGRNDSGEATPPAGTFTAVTAGTRHSCGIRTDGTVSCWGSNSSHQSTPTLDHFSNITAGHNYSCGVTTTGKTVCWGSEPADRPVVW
jgi:hypothetical protein